MAIWTADRRIYLDKHGNAVEADNPAKAVLLVPAGGALPMERAQALGLAVEPAEPAKAPNAKPTHANKIRRKTTEDK